MSIMWELVEDQHTGEKAIRMPFSALKDAENANEYAAGVWEILFSMSTPGRFKFARNRLAWLKEFPDADRLPGYGEAVAALWRARSCMRAKNWTLADLELAEFRASFEMAIGRAAIIKAQTTRAAAGQKSGEARRRKSLAIRAGVDSLIDRGFSQLEARAECAREMNLTKRQVRDAVKIQK